MYSSSFNSPASYTKAKGMGDQHIDNTIFLKELSVPEWRDLFLTKLGDIFQTFTTDYMMNVLDECVAIIKPEMELHFARWAEEHDQTIVSEWPTTPDGAYRYWEQRVERLRNTIRKRPNLLWTMIKEQFELSEEEMVHYFGPQPEMPPEAY